VGETTSAHRSSRPVCTGVWLGLNEIAVCQKIIEIVRIYLDCQYNNYTGRPSASRSEVNAEGIEEPISGNKTRRLRSQGFFNNEEVKISVRDVCECQIRISTWTEIFNWSQFGTNAWICMGSMLKNYGGKNLRQLTEINLVMTLRLIFMARGTLYIKHLSCISRRIRNSLALIMLITRTYLDF
jgi:hypothetical protein